MTDTDVPAGGPIEAPQSRKFLGALGPGLVTGASDDDPSGIATYSQAGAQFGYQLGWVMLFSWPLMCAVQEASARIGRVTGRGLAGNAKRHYPSWVVHSLVGLLLVANTINLGADLGAMAAALRLVIGGPELLYVGLFAVASVLLEVFVRYARYVSVLKWLTLSLFAYVAVAFVVQIPWGYVARHFFIPHIRLEAGYLVMIVAILGTTISPYLFFWQAQQEADDIRDHAGSKPLIRAPEQARSELVRIRWDTYVGMALSNLVALFIILTTAATLNTNGVTDIQTSAQAAEALRPIAGQFVFVVFALGIVGTGMLALPVLAGSAAYAVGEAFDMHVGLGRELRRAKSFYAIIAAATLVGALLNFTSIDPIKALFWTAVVNGVVAVPIMAMLLLMSNRRDVMGEHILPPMIRTVGWLATTMLALAAGGMFATFAF